MALPAENEADKKGGKAEPMMTETDLLPPDIVRPGYMEEDFVPPAELDIPIEGSLDALAVPPDLRRDEADDEEDFFPQPPKSLSRFLLPALLPASFGLHLAVFLFLLFFVSLPEIHLAGDPGDPDLEISWVTLLGGGAEPEAPAESLPAETPPEPEPEPADEPEALQVKEDKPPPPPEKKKPPPKQAPRKEPTPKSGAAKAPPGPGSPEGQSRTGGGGSGIQGGGAAVWKAVSVPKPAYPDASFAAGEQGQCLIRVTVLPSGQVGGVALVKSSGYSRLDQAALAAARRIQFRLNGARPAHSVMVKVPYRFNLRSR